MGDTIGGLASALFGRAGEPDIPEPKIPAAPAPSRKEDTGAKVVVGADASKDKRVSGGSSKSGSGSSGGDVLGGLGKGGLSI